MAPTSFTRPAITSRVFARWRSWQSRAWATSDSFPPKRPGWADTERWARRAPEALKVYEDALAFQEAGAIAVEMECVPEKVAAEITKRLKILTISLGSGRHCDGQFLYSCDLLGTHNDHYPRHVKKYCDFFGDSVKAFRRFKEEVDSGEFPAETNIIRPNEGEYRSFSGVYDCFPGPTQKGAAERELQWPPRSRIEMR